MKGIRNEIGNASQRLKEFGVQVENLNDGTGCGYLEELGAAAGAGNF